MFDTCSGKARAEGSVGGAPSRRRFLVQEEVGIATIWVRFSPTHLPSSGTLATIHGLPKTDRQKVGPLTSYAARPAVEIQGFRGEQGFKTS